MASRDDLNRRLSSERARRARPALQELLTTRSGIPEQSQRFLDVDEYAVLRDSYFEKLREWPTPKREVLESDAEDLRSELGEMGSRLEGVMVIWFHEADPFIPALEVPARPVLNSAIPNLVSSAYDLLLCTSDLEDGLAIELNYSSTLGAHRYEVVSWGMFAPVSKARR